MNAVVAEEVGRAPIVPLSEVADLIRGVSYPKADAREEPAPGFVPVLRATNIQDARLVLDSDLVFVAERNVSLDQLLRQGDIVVATSSGSRHLVGKSGQLHTAWRGSFGAFCATVRPRPGIHSRYLALFLQAPAYWRQITKKALGVNINNLRRGDLEMLELPLPPLAIQERIVDEIEKQFSRLDEAVASLKRVKAKLKRHKAAALKAAVDGRLVPTEAELAIRKGRRYESGAELLKRVLEERRVTWGAGAKFRDAVAPTHMEGLTLPEGWALASLEQLCTVFVDSAHRTPRYGEGIYPAIGPRDVVGGSLNLERVRLVCESEYLIQVARHIPMPGDVVYSRELSLGWGALLPAGVSVCLSQGMCLFRPTESISAKYFLTVLNAPFVRRQAESLAAGSAHPHLNLSDIKALVFPLPPRPEQDRIVGEVDRLITGLESAETTAEQSLSRARALRQAVLASAFRAVRRVEVEDGVVP